MSEQSGRGDKHGVVLSLCDKSGNALVSWAEAGYECIAVDLDADERTRHIGDGVIHHVQADVREYEPPEADYVIAFAWPPCTDLAVSGARWFQEKGLRALADAIDIVGACVETLQELDCPWLVENPKSTLSTHWRSPDHTFNPYEYAHYSERDESYSKETWLWTSDDFRMPVTDGVPESEADNRIHEMPPGEDRAEKRAETPLGFARAVFLAFHDDDYAQNPETTRQKRLVADGGEEVGRAISQFVSSESDEWATPPGFVRPLADAVGGFDLDPASGAERSPVARETYTEADDGLAQPWFGAVWCNPPYSEMDEWTRKAVAESNREDVDAILYLCKGDSSTEWWQLAASEAHAVAMIDHRLSFGDGDAAPFCSHVFAFGDVPDAALDVLDGQGAVFKTGAKHQRAEQAKLVTDGGRAEYDRGGSQVVESLHSLTVAALVAAVKHDVELPEDPLRAAARNHALAEGYDVQ